MDRTVVRGGLGRRRSIAAVCLVLLVGGLAIAWPAFRRLSSVDRAIDASRLQIAAVTVGTLVRDAAADGRIVSANAPTLFAASAGIVTLHVKAGDPVTRGQVLATIDSPELRSRFTQEQAQLQSLDVALGRARIAARQSDTRNASSIELAQVRLQSARRNLERARQTYEEGLLNKVDYERAQDDVQLAEVELKTAQAARGLEQETAQYEIQTQQLARTRQASMSDEVARQVERLSIVAPFDGLIGAISVQDRDALNANQAVLTVVNLDAYEIEFSLPENEAAEAGPGTPVRVLYEGREYDGKVTAISPSVSDSLVKGRAVFAGATPSTLRQNQRVSLRLLFETRPRVLTLPRGAFLQSGGGRLAYVVRDDVATRVAIGTGARSLSLVEITSGLREGDQVIVSDTSEFSGAERLLLRNRN
ncbi:ABC transporter permease [Luteitalea sp. TBR-22]|uniref:efflux RND transporter periplasmic adaptor subunit n=1 Tax=Luteitalea sp. TBR-22 TaxID=2802971 RepID=UPI001AF059A6|nr:efflux RND transporter periplasmic adaptor subunit [Luteitalea sp. TBR-22]BCS31633.1 ABC transporter permease [Luteitalea sp. TBR-22]